VIEVALELRGIAKRFGPVHALRGADFTLRAGEVHALLGENGAGKSTLMRVAYGLIPPDSGTILVHGRPSSPRSPHQARKLGIGMVHQHFTAIPALTVAENIALAAGWGVQPAALQSRVQQLLQRTPFRSIPRHAPGTSPLPSNSGWRSSRHSPAMPPSPFSGGGLGGLAGATLVLAQVGTFAEKMTAGRGYIAIAIVVLGRWHPAGVALAALLFGAATALQFLFQSLGLAVPYQFFLALPYLLTLLALAGAIGRVRAPAGLAADE
jgi:hypothetical protein